MTSKDPIVEINDGRLQGKTKVDWLGGKYYSFQGIPYAKPPLGKLRFKAPQPNEPWAGIRDATKEGNDCYSRHMIIQNFVGSEDCLFLNVYTPQLPHENSQPMPIMVWIHGGAFIFGSGSTEFYGPEFLVSEAVVLVTINYRLGLLGFANFSDPTLEAPGNAGFKDQVQALKWVQQNISKFGGNPNNVTIFGESAGAASVHLLMMSPSAKGLFHKAIAQSGISSSKWSVGKQTAPLIAKALGSEKASEKDIFDILCKMSMEEILEMQEKIPKAESVSENQSCGMVVEPPSKSAFLTRDPWDILTSGSYNHVPLMVGYTSREGMIMEWSQKMKYGDIKWISNYKDVIPFDLKDVSDDVVSIAADKIKAFYYGDETPSLDNIVQYHLIFTDAYFFIAINTAVRQHTKTSTYPTYYYRMSVESELNIFKRMSNINSAGAAHGDDLGYLFKNIATPRIRPNSSEDIAVRRFLKLWTSFARNGNPNPTEKCSLINITWPPCKSYNELHFLDIGDNLTIGMNPDYERAEFWDEILKLCFPERYKSTH